MNAYQNKNISSFQLQTETKILVHFYRKSGYPVKYLPVLSRRHPFSSPFKGLEIIV